MFKENTIVSLEYFNIIKNINNNYLNYIKSYHSLTKEFAQKLYTIQQNNDKKTKEILSNISKEQSDNLSFIIKYENVFPKIFQQHLDNLYNFIINLEKEIKSHETFLNEKKKLVNKYQNEFEEVKHKFTKKKNDIEKSEKSFLNNISKLEETIYEYYTQKEKGKEKKEHKKMNIATKIISGININNNQNIITEEQINNNIKSTLKLENEYKESIQSGNLLQDNYIKIDNSSSENIKKIILDLSNEFKLSIMNILVPMKNSFQIPFSEIEKFLSESSKLEEEKTIDKTLKEHFENNMIKKEEYIPKKYDLKVLKNEKNKNEHNKKSNKLFSSLNLNIFKKKSETSLSKTEKKVSVLEDGLEVMNFIDDENALLTTKKMIHNFKLINDGGYKLDEEVEKMTSKKLINKIFANFKRQRKKNSSDDKDNVNKIKENDIFDNLEELEEENINNKDKDKDEFIIINTDEEIINITEDEINLFEILLDKHYNRIIFLQQLNKFRATGKIIIPKKIGEIIAKFFNIILNTVKRDNDIHSGKNIILLSQTYYILDNNKKKYLQELVWDHQIFQDMKFWEDLLNLEINKEINKFIKVEEKKQNKENLNLEGIKDMDQKKLSTLYFSQFVTICDNMISFKVSKEDIYKLIESKINEYKMTQEVVDNIKNVVEIRIKEQKEENEQL